MRLGSRPVPALDFIPPAPYFFPHRIYSCGEEKAEEAIATLVVWHIQTGLCIWERWTGGTPDSAHRGRPISAPRFRRGRAFRASSPYKAAENLPHVSQSVPEMAGAGASGRPGGSPAPGTGVAGRPGAAVHLRRVRLR